MIKKLFRWIKGLFVKKSLVKEITTKYLPKHIDETPTTPYKKTKIRKGYIDPSQPVKTSQKKPARVFIHKDKTYSRLFTRFQMNKEAKTYRKSLVIQGKKQDDKGNVIVVQKPYVKSEYKSLNDYIKYTRGFNYKQATK